MNASWPGVSRKTTCRVAASDVVRADVLGDAARLARGDAWSSRMASSSDVLPWSTWPMTVITGARGTQVLGLRLDRLLLDHLLLEGLDGGLVPELLGDLDRERRLERLVHGGHDAARDERLHDVAAT